MKRKELTDLALKSLTDEISPEERNVIESELLQDHTFNAGFAERVLNSVNRAQSGFLFGYENLRSFTTAFNRLAITGIAAIILLAITLFISHGSLSFDTLVGIDTEVDEGMISLLLE